ncbi:hypothetical protein BDZ88DRAFT_486766 [Geranomyces variabilis]|nr:hypothetical protein BDZ88DRAFT_486766 [Geranomyces variabilis]KAJ3142444.1 hypothetical protein HDU90_004718 [Geranomyces variabilis]
MFSVLKVASLPNKGRSYVVTRDVPAGTILLRSRAYVAVPDCGSKSQVCAHCMLRDASDVTYPHRAPGASVKLPHGCKSCQQVFYCSAECQKADSEHYHASECAWLKELFLGLPAASPDRVEAFNSSSNGTQEPEPVKNSQGFSSYELDFIWMLARVLINRAREMKTPAHDASDANAAAADIAAAGKPSSADIWAFVANAAAFSPTAIDRFVTIARVLAALVRTAILPTAGFPASAENTLLPPGEDALPPSLRTSLPPLESSIVALICKEECNSFGLYTFAYAGAKIPRQSYGIGLYPDAVFFNHSCLPNVGHVTREGNGLRGADESFGADMVFYAARDMVEGEEAVISYVALDESRGRRDGERRTWLEQNFFFACDCKRCNGDAEGTASDIELRKRLDRHLCGKDGCCGWFVPPQLVTKGAKDSRNDSGKDLARRITEFPERQRATSRPWICEACGRERS